MILITFITISSVVTLLSVLSIMILTIIGLVKLDKIEQKNKTISEDKNNNSGIDINPSMLMNLKGWDIDPTIFMMMDDGKIDPLLFTKILTDIDNFKKNNVSFYKILHAISSEKYEIDNILSKSEGTDDDILLAISDTLEYTRILIYKMAKNERYIGTVVDSVKKCYDK